MSTLPQRTNPILSDPALDNPIWHALISRQQHLAEGEALARRFPPEIGPLSGMLSHGPEPYQALARLARPDEPLVLFSEAKLAPPPGWRTELDGALVQMVLDKPLTEVETEDIEALTDADVPDMLALTRLTKPGPFHERTLELGGYVGIKESGRLLAMAGERLRMPGFTEISAVCTHPDVQGRGYAKRLMTVVGQGIIQRGETPFLHAWAHNTQAIRAYEKLGFILSRQLWATVLRPPAPQGEGE